MNKETNTAATIHPGPSKEIWDAALTRSGLDPAGVTEYNTHAATEKAAPEINEIVNEQGILEIKEFLEANHRKGEGAFTPEMLRAWATDAEFQMSMGNPPSIEIRAADCVLGRTLEYTISDNGVSPRANK